MELNEEQQEKFLGKIKKLWKDKACEVCDDKDWSFSTQLFVLKEYHGIVNTNKEKEIVQPILTIRCCNCGNIKIFNAVISGTINDKSGKIN